jgi:hypothetical protein
MNCHFNVEKEVPMPLDPGTFAPNPITPEPSTITQLSRDLLAAHALLIAEGWCPHLRRAARRPTCEIGTP